VGVERLKQTERLRHHADAPFDGGVIRIEALAEQFDFAGGGVQQTGHAADGGALAGTVGAEEAEHGAGAHREDRFSTATF
jgi:hypothetical protein